MPSLNNFINFFSCMCLIFSILRFDIFHFGFTIFCYNASTKAFSPIVVTNNKIIIDKKIIIYESIFSDLLF